MVCAAAGFGAAGVSVLYGPASILFIPDSLVFGAVPGSRTLDS